MRRLVNLSNTLYHKRFREIYKLVFTADLDSVKDFSKWYEKEQDIVTRATPLWIICESKILNKRIWITKEFNDFKITTATLDLDVKTSEYSNSFKHFYFSKQGELVEHLENLLMPCLEDNSIQKEEQYERVV